MPDYAALRANMVESQVRPADVTDHAIQAAMRECPRERFVPAAKRALAYMDGCIEVARGRFLLDPRSFSKMLQLAGVQATDRVLDVGCATGYSTAVLARLGRQVIGLEPEPELAEAARANLRDLGLADAEVVAGALAGGCPEKGPYDVILVNGSVPTPPETLFAQLKDGGRLAAILSRGVPGTQGKATLFVKADGEVSGVPHFDAGAPPLPGFFLQPSFSF